MDYLDRGKQIRHHYLLLTGYICIGVAIVISTLVLVYQAYGFGVAKDGAVIQNGLVFFSSQPDPADIYINGQRNKEQTNTRLIVPEGRYSVELRRQGYINWKRDIEVTGGSVSHYDYPFLIPEKLEPKAVQTYAAAPGMMTQSPDRRWLLVQSPGSLTNFEVHDLKGADKPVTSLKLPDGVLTKATQPGERLEIVEWSSDNERFLLEHFFDGRSEYVIVDRPDPEKSRNLNVSLGLSPTKLTLQDKKYDRYFVTDATGKLMTVKLEDPKPETVLTNVLAYKSYGADMVLYATSKDAPTGKVLIRLLVDGKTYEIRSFNAGSTYLLDLAKYSDDLYVAAGASGQNKVYIYDDPLGQQKERPNRALVPLQVLHVPGPNYLSFSNSAQFVMAENGQHFAVYDLENTKGFNYVASQPLDAPQAHASWMDGNRLLYTSGGKLVIFDYDYMNQRTIGSSLPAYLPAFDPDYEDVFTLSPGSTAGQAQLVQTPLLTAQDR